MPSAAKTISAYLKKINAYETVSTSRMYALDGPTSHGWYTTGAGGGFAGQGGLSFGVTVLFKWADLSTSTPTYLSRYFGSTGGGWDINSDTATNLYMTAYAANLIGNASNFSYSANTNTNAFTLLYDQTANTIQGMYNKTTGPVFTVSPSPSPNNIYSVPIPSSTPMTLHGVNGTAITNGYYFGTGSWQGSTPVTTTNVSAWLDTLKTASNIPSSAPTGATSYKRWSIRDTLGLGSSVYMGQPVPTINEIESNSATDRATATIHGGSSTIDVSTLTAFNVAGMSWGW